MSDTAIHAANTDTTCSHAKPLNTLAAGEHAVIDRLELSDTDSGRIMRLGLTPGRRIQLIRTGARPIVATAGARISLDRSLASAIFVATHANPST